jgi:hypothetical protein
VAKAKSQRSLENWGKQKWRTASGKPSGETGERYMPEAALRALSYEEIQATNKKKRAGTRAGKQHVPNTPAARRATKAARSRTK